MSATSERTDLLTAPDCESSRCVVCGWPRENGHHPCHDSKGPRVAVCGQGNLDKCHRLAHGYGLDFRYSARHGWSFTATDEAASDINKRRGRSGLPRVRGGQHPCIIAPDFDAVDEPIALDAKPEPDGDLLDECRRAITESVGIEGAVAWAQGAALLRVFDHLHATLSAGDAAREYRAFYEPLGFSSALASKRILIARHVPADAGIGPAKAYEVALGVKEEAWTLDAGLALAREASCSDLKARRTGGEPEARPERHLMCPACKTTHAASEYLTVKEGA
jgi:hypothetical protein